MQISPSSPENVPTHTALWPIKIISPLRNPIKEDDCLLYFDFLHSFFNWENKVTKGCHDVIETICYATNTRPTYFFQEHDDIKKYGG